MKGPCCKCAFPLEESNCREYDSDTPLMYAAFNGHKECLNVWLESGANVNAVNSAGDTALGHAAGKGHNSSVKVLMEAGADMNIRNNEGKTPLMIAQAFKGSSIVRDLIGEGANVNITDNNGETALDLATRKASVTCIDILLKSNVVCTTNSLFYAVSNGLYKYADFFIRQGANVNSQFSTRSIPNQTPLIVAAHNGRTKCLKLLLESGSFVNLADGNGLTALMAAVAGKQSECVKQLLKAGADVNSSDNDGDTALGIAAKHWPDRNYILLLMKAGARINIRNKTGRNALTIHIKENDTIHHETAMLLDLYAAGETLEAEHRDTLGENLRSLRLKHLSREALRKHLIDLDPHEHLFNRITLLGLPDLIFS